MRSLEKRQRETIEEARRLANYFINLERATDLSVPKAISRAADKLGLKESDLQALRYRSHLMAGVYADVLETLRQADERDYEQWRIEGELHPKIKDSPTNDPSVTTVHCLSGRGD